MSDMPERIYADPKTGQWFAHQSGCNYVRADAHDTLKAENEEQRERLIQFANAFDAGYAAAERALAERAGGVRPLPERAPYEVLQVLGREYETTGDMWAALCDALTTEPAAPEGHQEAVSLPPYGKMPFDELGRDVSEAGIGVRRDFDFGETYPGHVMTGINFNSLNRIVSKYATRPSERAVTEAMVDGVLDAAGDYMGMQYGNTALHHPTDRARIKAAMEAGRHD